MRHEEIIQGYTMNSSKLFKVGSILIPLVNVGLILFGMIYVIYGKLMPYHLAFIGLTPEEIATLPPNLITLSNLSIILVGFLFLSSGATTILIWYKSFRKGEKWAWFAVLICDGLVFIPLIGVIYTVAGFGFPFPIGCASLILWIICLGFTAKDILNPKQS
jgi:hypothetical protein